MISVWVIKMPSVVLLTLLCLGCQTPRHDADRSSKVDTVQDQQEEYAVIGVTLSSIVQELNMSIDAMSGSYRCYVLGRSVDPISQGHNPEKEIRSRMNHSYPLPVSMSLPAEGDVAKVITAASILFAARKMAKEMFSRPPKPWRAASATLTFTLGKAVPKRDDGQDLALTSPVYRHSAEWRPWVQTIWLKRNGVEGLEYVDGRTYELTPEPGVLVIYRGPYVLAEFNDVEDWGFWGDNNGAEVKAKYKVDPKLG